jgi:phage baseplate assembly protein gpV
MILLNAAPAGNGAADPCRNLNKYNYLYTLYVFGTFDGATFTLEVTPDNGTTWFTVPSTNVTVKSVMNVEFKATHVRGVVTGGTAPAINAVLI